MGSKTNMAVQMLSTLTDRLRSVGALGDTHSGDRNIYEQCGWKKTLDFTDYKYIFDRNGIGFRIVDAMPRASWAETPSVKGSDELVNAWERLVNFSDRGLMHYLYRADSMSGVGKYGVLFLGMDDGADPSESVSNASKLLFARPYFSEDANITRWETDATNPRYGLPTEYSLKPKANNSEAFLTAHHSRVLHLAEGSLSSDVYGVPRLQRVMNRLYDMRKILGGSAEGFWRTGFPGLGLSLDKEVSLTEQQKEDMNDEAEDFVHGLTRLLRLQGVDIQELSASPSDPTAHMEIQLACISIATGIPIRILKGSERGELASTQDYRQWQDRIEERRVLYLNPVVMKPLVRKLMSAGLLPEEDDFEIEWTTPEESDRERARIAREWSSALGAYSAEGSDAREVIPPKQYLTEVWKIPEERAQEITDAVDEYRKDKLDADAERAEKVAEAEGKGGDNKEKPDKPSGSPVRPPDGQSKGSEEGSVR